MKTENITTTRTTRNELAFFHVSQLFAGVMPMLETVTMADSVCECWIEFVNDSGETVRLVPDSTGWQDGRREVVVMNTATGRNCKLFFTADGRPSTVTMDNREAVDLLWSIPNPVLNWAVSHAKGR